MGFQSKYTGNQIEIGIDKAYGFDKKIQEVVKDTTNNIKKSEEQLIETVEDMITEAIQNLVNQDPWIEL